MTLFTGSEAHYLQWAIGHHPATSPLFSFNSCDWRLHLKHDLKLNAFLVENDAYSLELVRMNAPCEMQPFSVTCFARRGGRGGIVCKVTEFDAACSSNTRQKKTISVLEEDIIFPYGTNGVQNIVEYIIIFRKGVGPTFASEAPGDKESTSSAVLNLDRISGLSSDFGNLLTSGEASDVQLRCRGGVTRSAHWLVLVARSEVFASMFRSEMAERGSGVVDMGDVDSSTMDLFLRYVYTGVVVVPNIPQDGLLELHSMADKYEVHLLKKLCLDSIVQRMNADNCLEILTYAEGREDVELTDATTAYILNHPACLKIDAWRQFSKEHSWLANKVCSKVFDKVYFDM